MKKPILKILQSQGFGSRKDCLWLIRNSRVQIGGKICSNPSELRETNQLRFSVSSNQWVYRENLYIAMNKPSGYECSHNPRHHESVFTLLPREFINRGIQSAGRLDVDTEGLLLFSDDGSFIHQLISPRQRILKIYRITLKHKLSEEQKRRLLSGVELRNEKKTVKAVELVQLEDRVLQMTIDSGCYHQVRRMIAAASNRVLYLRREQIGKLRLGAQLNLDSGQWSHVDPGQCL